MLLRALTKTLLFFPIIIFGTIIYVANDFKKHKLGYIFIFLIVAIVLFGFYRGYRAGPFNPQLD